MCGPPYNLLNACTHSRGEIGTGTYGLHSLCQVVFPICAARLTVTHVQLLCRLQTVKHHQQQLSPSFFLQWKQCLLHFPVQSNTISGWFGRQPAGFLRGLKCRCDDYAFFSRTDILSAALSPCKKGHWCNKKGRLMHGSIVNLIR